MSAASILCTLMRDLTGTTVGQYDVKERLGAGGMAIVYRSVQQPLGREVALKALAASLVEEPGFMQRFENEARILGSLDHPNILPIIDFNRIQDVCFLTMPLVRDGSLPRADGPEPAAQHRRSLALPARGR